MTRINFNVFNPALKRIYKISGIILLALVAAGSSQARQNPELSTPRKSLYNFIYWQQEEHPDLEKASRIMKLAEGSSEEKISLSKHLFKVLNAYGLLIDFTAVPDSADYTDSLSGTSKYVLSNRLPAVYIVKDGDDWVFSEYTIEQIPDLYRATFSSYSEALVDRLPAWLHQKWLGIYLWQYLAVFAVILIGLVIRKTFEFVLENYVRRLVRKTKLKWDDQILDSVSKPISFIFLMVVYYYFYTDLLFNVRVNRILANGLEIAISAGAIWLFYNLAGFAASYLTHLASKTESEYDDQLVPLIRMTLRFFVVFMGVVAILQNSGYDVTSLIAGLGIGGLAVALAARETLANFFGSVTIFLDRPFRAGDWIKVGDIEGTVVEIGFRSTRIRTFYTSLVSIPNSTLANTNIDNMGLRQYRRFRTFLDLKLETPAAGVEAFVEGIKGVIKANKNFRQDYYEVDLYEITDGRLRIIVYAFLNAQNYTVELQQRHNFLLEALRLAGRLGVELTYPTQKLHIEQKTGDPEQMLSEDELIKRLEDFGPGGTEGRPDGYRLFKDGKEVDFGSKS